MVSLDVDPLNHTSRKPTPKPLKDQTPLLIGALDTTRQRDVTHGDADSATPARNAVGADTQHLNALPEPNEEK